MNDAARAALVELLGERVAFGVPMARHTSLGVGGPVEALAEPANAEEVVACLALCERFDLPLTPIGGGFNLLVRDGGLPGVAVRTGNLRGLSHQGAQLSAQAGVSHAQVTRFCVEQGLRGLEFAAGIPGSVGGWIAMNAGIPTREMADAVAAVDVATPKGIEKHTASALEFRYRSAGALDGGAGIALCAHFAVDPGKAAEIREQVAKHLTHRRLTQPVNQPSCGSVFKNPTGEHAGQLIEAAGLKGLRIGAAAISELHANFIVTERDATAADVLELIESAREAVQHQSGIRLEAEVRIVGVAA